MSHWSVRASSLLPPLLAWQPPQRLVFQLARTTSAGALEAADFAASSNAYTSGACDASRIVHTRCLIVDDNPRFLESARNLLQMQGVSVVGTATNRSEAVAIAATDHPDVALVDVDLAEENGLDVARALAACKEPVPVILISVYGEHEIQDVLDNSRALGFLPKSILSRQAIEDLLHRAHQNPAR
jgi:CheY-like chemotaxis protein